MNKLPKLGRVIKIKFWSLRNGLGGGLGVIFDIDTQVERLCRRAKVDGGWKWQIKDAFKLSEYDYFVETDQDILNEIGMDVSDIKGLT